MNDYADIVRNGLWQNNPGLVQLLGLCPLLAVTGTLINGLTLGLATLFVLTGSNVAISVIRRAIPSAVRIPVFIVIIATLVGVVELVMHAYFYDLWGILGIFVPLIVTNCVIMGRAEAFASRWSTSRAAVDALAMGGGFTAVLLVLGALREFIAQGTLLADADLLFGPIAAGWTVQLTPPGMGVLLAALPPGAFISLGLLVALKHWIDKQLAQPSTDAQPAAQTSDTPASPS